MIQELHQEEPIQELSQDESIHELKIDELNQDELNQDELNHEELNHEELHQDGSIHESAVIGPQMSGHMIKHILGSRIGHRCSMGSRSSSIICAARATSAR